MKISRVHIFKSTLTEEQENILDFLICAFSHDGLFFTLPCCVLKKNGTSQKVARKYLQLTKSKDVRHIKNIRKPENTKFADFCQFPEKLFSRSIHSNYIIQLAMKKTTISLSSLSVPSYCDENNVDTEPKQSS